MNSKPVLDPHAAREAEKYTHPIPSREYILTLFTPKKRVLTGQQLADLLNLTTPIQKEALRRRLRAMRRDGQLLWKRGKGYNLAKSSLFIKGKVVGNKEEFGFVIPEDGSTDLFLSAYQMRQVFPNDTVLVRIIGEDRRGRREATIIEVLDRNTETIVGQYLANTDPLKVIPSHPRIHHSIIIAPGSQLNAKHLEMVLVEIIHQPNLHHPPTGRIVKILGDKALASVDTDVAIHQYQLPYEWPSKVKKEIAHLKKHPPAEKTIERVDLRHLPFVTIDGEDSKDFDDAVYCERKNKQWQLWVAIADVSHFVKPDTALDEAAKERGNSVYFPNQVLPMLPDILSNDWCSLNPKVDRFCLVCEMTLTSTGKLKNYHFYPAIIYSHARLTYTTVSQYLETENYTDEHQSLTQPLKNLASIHTILSQARQKRGAIDFNLQETQMVFKEDNSIEKIIPRERTLAHRIIEECMLMANIAAAKFLLDHKIPSLFRIHEPPLPDKLTELKTFLSSLGLNASLDSEPKPMDYAKLLQATADHPENRLIQTMVLRAMSQAIYSPKNKGHFGLAYSEYTHFTSPIRRYPDLLVHRAIYAVLLQQKTKRSFIYDEKTLEHIGSHCSMTERRADEATRDVANALKCQLMQKHLGEVFEGVISHVTHFGLFIELQATLAEGLLHISHLRDDHYLFDAQKMVLQGQRQGKRYRLGDKITVQVARVDVDAREIDFELHESV